MALTSKVVVEVDFYLIHQNFWFYYIKIFIKDIEFFISFWLFWKHYKIKCICHPIFFFYVHVNYT